MPAERMPPSTSAVPDAPCASWAERPLLAITRLVIRYPLVTLAIAAALTAACALLSQTRLHFRTNRLDLLNPQSQFNRLWLDYLDEFGEGEDAVVVVEGAGPGEIVPVMAAVAGRLATEPRLFQGVLYQIDTSKLRAKGLHQASVDDLQKLAGFLDGLGPVLDGDWSPLCLRSIAGGVGAGAAASAAAGPSAEAQQHVARLSQGLRAALDGRYLSPWTDLSAALPVETAAQPLLSASGKIGFVLLKLVNENPDADFVRGAQSITRLRQILAEVQAGHARVKVGLTGLPVIEHDEMLSSQTSMTTVSLLSLLGVSVLFVAGFGGWRHPLLAVASLSVGTAWAFGYIALAIGHLNILSSAFAVILIGQGIDFSMYYVAQYLQLRRTIGESGAALLETVRSVGPGIATGAITTAVAFFMAGLTEFTGVAELGMIAGGGILLCWLAGLTVLPALIHLLDTRWPGKYPSSPVDVRSWLEPFLARPRLLLAATSALMLFLATGLAHPLYDHNLLHLQAKGIESVDLEQRLLAEGEQSASFALSTADSPEEIAALKQRFLQLPSVKRVDEIATHFPRPSAQRQALVEAIHRRLAALPTQAPSLPLVSVADVGLLMGRLGQAGLAAIDPAVLAARSPADIARALSAYQQQMADDLVTLLGGVAAVADPRPPAPTDLPPSLVMRFVGRRGKHLMKIYGKGDLWDMAAMERFVQEVRSVDPRATGNPMQVYEASHQMKRSYEEAALYALFIIVPVVFFDFRSLRMTLLALLPLGLGMLSLFGLLGLLNIPLNPANMIVLPLILGIGIDAGVHVVHDFCSQRGGYRISASTASAVVINTVTNMAGFGSLMIASHRGLQSLGRVLTIGLGCCLFASLVMLPAVLMLIRRSSPTPAADVDAGPELLPLDRAAEPDDALEAVA